MTEYDIRPMYEEQVRKDTITSLHANGGVLEVRYADGTMAIYKKSKWRNKFKLIKKRAWLGIAIRVIIIVYIWEI